MNWLFQEPSRDRRLGETLRQLENPSQVSDTELRQRIVSAAAPRLDALRSSKPHWWEWISRWMPVAVPVGVSAGLAAGLLLLGAEDALPTERYAVEAGADSALVVAAYSEAPEEGQLTGYLVTPEAGDWLLEEAVTQ